MRKNKNNDLRGITQGKGSVQEFIVKKLRKAHDDPYVSEIRGWLRKQYPGHYKRGYSVTNYHLNILEKQGIISSYIDGKNEKRYFTQTIARFETEEEDNEPITLIQ